jgi:soluble lytic murein transglycosylase
VIFIASALLVATPASAQPGVPPGIERAAERVRRNDVEGALTALAALPETDRGSPGARYLEGRLRERAGDVDRAIDADAGAVAPLDAELARDASSRRARLLARRGRCGEAEPIFAALDRASPADRAARAECSLVRGQLDDAIERLAAAAEEDAAGVDSFSLRLALAEAQVRAGARDRAIPTLRALAIERPDHPDASRAIDALAELTGDEVTFTVEERLARAERLGTALLHDEAVAELEGIARPRDAALARRLLHLRGMELFRSRHAYADAATVLRQAVAAGGGVEDAFHAARALSRSGDDAGAIRAYRVVMRTGGEHRLAAEAEYLAAWLELRLGRRTAARSLERFLDGPRAPRVPDLAREARWHLAMDAFRGGAHGRAAPLFGAYAAESTDPLVEGRGTYWRARALEEANRRDEAIAAYRTTIGVTALHWYALLARQRLVALGEEPGDPFLEPAREDTWSPARISLPANVTTLLALGLDRDARAWVRAHERELRGQADQRAMVQQYLAIGEHVRAYRMTASLDALERPATGGEQWAWLAAYPRAYEAQVTSAAAAQSLDPEVLWAIMRQESAYDSDAVSYADAIGLMQLLPSTASRVARGMGVPYRREQLFDPDWNARFGAAYVRSLVDAHGVPLAFAAFNAGGHRVVEWLARSGETDLDLFVEDIPIDQTRNYVRRVTSHYARYLYLRDPSAGWPELDLPERVAPR